MAQVSIVESGMTFRVEEEKLYHIERAHFYESLGEGIKRPEFLMERDGVMVFVEAKRSSPMPKGEEFTRWCEEIRDKFENALVLFNTVKMRRHGAAAYKEVPSAFRAINAGKVSYQFYLVINGHPKEWLVPIHDKLQLLMKSTFKMWNINDTAIKVVNDGMARAKSFII